MAGSVALLTESSQLQLAVSGPAPRVRQLVRTAGRAPIAMRASQLLDQVIPFQ